jgi:hypothetical protein
MESEGQIERSRQRTRAREAEAALGPVGNLFASPAVARVLTVFLRNPDTRLTLSQIKDQAGRRAKVTVQSGLRTLIASGLVYSEGRGNRTLYRYAADHELGRRMLRLIEASQREATIEARNDIPWLEQLMRETPPTPPTRPFGSRTEEIPDSDATERVLAAGEPVEESERGRTRPGLRTRV